LLQAIHVEVGTPRCVALSNKDRDRSLQCETS